MQHWYEAIRLPVTAQLRTPAYDAVIASGQLDLIRDDSLRRALSDFEHARSMYQLNIARVADAFLLGSVQELRMEFGSLGTFFGRPPSQRLDLSDAEQRAFFASRRAYGVLAGVYGGSANISRYLEGISSQSRTIAEILRRQREVLR